MELSKVKNENRSNLKALGIVTQFFYETLAACAIGYFLGGLIDNWLNLNLVFTAILMVLGIFAGIRNLIIKAMKLEE